ncbi:MAG TPA: hypothetical protein VHF89_07560, partial [Solirubrobacteraceae bacterium]|nr:hypothetical protein [Solirubrobacteraceae bacterium]
AAPSDVAQLGKLVAGAGLVQPQSAAPPAQPPPSGPAPPAQAPAAPGEAMRWLRDLMEKAELLSRDVVAEPQFAAGVDRWSGEMQQLREMLVKAGVVPGGGSGTQP